MSAHFLFQAWISGPFAWRLTAFSLSLSTELVSLPEFTSDNDIGRFSFPVSLRRKPPYRFFVFLVDFDASGVFVVLSRMMVSCLEGDLASDPRGLEDDSGSGVRKRTGEGVKEVFRVLLVPSLTWPLVLLLLVVAFFGFVFDFSLGSGAAFF